MAPAGYGSREYPVTDAKKVVSVKLAVVVPICDEQENLPDLYRRLAVALDGIADLQWQVIYVNDGSRDQSLQEISRQHLSDPRFTLVDLSRNFGHQAAITAGLAHADADAVVVMDGDLQDPPETIPELVRAWREGAAVVLGQRLSRGETGPRRLGFDLFHKLFGWVSDFPIPGNIGVFSLLDRRAVRELLRMPETHRFLPGLMSWIGFERRTVSYHRSARSAGKPKQTSRRLIRYAMDAAFGFSFKPVRLVTFTGVAFSAAGVLLWCDHLLKRFAGGGSAQAGFSSIVPLLLFLGGAQLIAMGLLGAYVARIYEEVKRRPTYIVRRTLGLGGSGEPPRE